MIQHTVAFRLIHPRGSEAEAGFLAAGRRVLASIPGVEDFALSEQVGKKSPLTWHFSMLFADEATYAAYNDHPDHLHFVESRWLPEVAEFQEWDLVEVL